MDIKTKALKVIEGYSLLCEHLPTTQKIDAFTFFYKMAHVGLGHCQNPHEDWRAELEETYQKMVDEQIIDKE